MHPEPDVQGRYRVAPYVIPEAGRKEMINWLFTVKIPTSFGVKAMKVFSDFNKGDCQQFAASKMSVQSQSTRA